MVNWNEIKCHECESFRKCRKENISKSSTICQKRRKMIPDKRKDEVSKESMTKAMLFHLLKGSKKD